MGRILVTISTLLLVAFVAPAGAQTTGGGVDGAQAQPTPPAQEEDDPDRDINRAQPDFTLVALPTTLRVPRHKSSFRITHRFTRPLGAGNFGDLVSDLFGLDGGALIGLEYRFGVFRGTQAGIHRTSDKTIQFMAQHDLKRQSDTFPIGINVIGAIEGLDNFQESYSPAIGLLLSRELADWAALYVEPFWVNNSNPLPQELSNDDNNTVMVGLAARLRIRPTVYLVFEGTPRVAGFSPGDTQASFGIEKRSGGHLFQLNFSNGLGTTFGQLARGGFTDDDWYLGFNISRKFF